MALINTERPLTFDMVKGQDNLVKMLSNDLIKKNIKGAYLYFGTRGTGKTTLARIFARALNCEHPKEDGSPCNQCSACKEILSGSSLGVYELDAASHNSVDDVRNIIQKISFKTFLKYTVVIMDEVHMLSPAAFNALLKTLEEPPKNVVFILCTTEKHKVPATIISRCSPYQFKKISFNTIAEHLKEVIEKFQKAGQKITYEDNALAMIAKAADGGMRDALSIMDNFFSMEHISADIVAVHLGISDDDIIFAILNGIADKNLNMSIDAVKYAAEKDVSFSFLVKRVYEILLDMIDFQTIGDCGAIIGTEYYQNAIKDLAVKLSAEKAFQILDEFKKIYQLSSANLELSIISAVFSVVYQNNHIEELQKEIGKLRSDINKLKEQQCSLLNNNILSSLSVVTQVEGFDKKDSSDIKIADHDKKSAVDSYFENMARNYDENFEYEEELPSFGESVADRGFVQNKKTVDSTVISGGEKTLNQIPDGISFEELEKMDFQKTDSAPFEEEPDRIVSEQESEEEDSFFDDLFMDYARQF